MVRSFWRPLLTGIILLLPWYPGCAASRAVNPANQPSVQQPAIGQQAGIVPDVPFRAASHGTAQVSARESIEAVAPPDAHSDAAQALSKSEVLFFGRDSLELEELLELVFQYNPNLQAMHSAWQAAAARYPQEVSLDDPMLDVMLAPASFSSNSNVPESWSVEASQKIPWFGKRDFRGRVAAEQAGAAALDTEDVRLQLALATRLAYADLALATKTLELNTTESKLLEELRAVAQVKYETNLAPQQDVLQANVEYADLTRKRVEIARAKRVAEARINTLLHRHPLTPLPSPRPSTILSAVIANEDQLLEMAVQARPDLAAQAARISAEQFAYFLAESEFHPDVELYGRHDRFWFDSEQQNSVGIKLNLPVQRRRRWGALQEAKAKLAKAQAEYAARVAQIRLEVATAHQRLLEARESERLYREVIITAAEQNVASARAGYEAGAVNFLTLVAAQRQLLDFRQKQAEAVSEFQRQLAELERAVGTRVAS